MLIGLVALFGLRRICKDGELNVNQWLRYRILNFYILIPGLPLIRFTPLYDEPKTVMLTRTLFKISRKKGLTTPPTKLIMALYFGTPGMEKAWCYTLETVPTGWPGRRPHSPAAYIRRRLPYDGTDSVFLAQLSCECNNSFVNLLSDTYETQTLLKHRQQN